jgi:hypothetical protein
MDKYLTDPVIQLPMLLLKCPGCGNQMKYQHMKALDRQKRKRCVYCGRSFLVVDCIAKQL